VPGLGPSRFRRLLDAVGSALAALDAGAAAIAEATGLPESALLQAPGVVSGLEEVEQQLASLDDEGVQALIWHDETYPTRLLDTSSPPPVLWWRSSGPSTQPEAAVAIIGSREVPDVALAEAFRIGRGLAEVGVVVVSGMAAGIDATAHEAALACGGPTVGVCGCGIALALARGRGGLAGRIAEQGALCSELAPSAPLSTGTLFARNRIISGLVDAVIVVETRPEGGAVHAAKCALQEGRPVLAVDWPDSRAGGNHDLLTAGARPFEPGADPLSAFAEAIED
jgi:DNA processing protein